MNKNLGMILLSIWLILYGLKYPFSINLPESALPILALAAGVVILLLGDGFRMTLNRNLGMVLLSVWLIVQGAVSLFTIGVPGIRYILPILALAAGVVILLLDPVRRNKRLGMILLGVFLVYHAVIRLIDVNVTASAYVWSILALATGIVILLFDKASA
jgi:hypothetical protein